MRQKTTEELLNIIKNKQSTQELETYADTYLESNNSQTIGEYLEQKIIEKKQSKKDVIKRSGISRTYAYQILQGTRQPSRNKVLAFCLSLSLSIEETGKALTINQSGKLYPRNKRDAIILYAINKQMNTMDTNILLYEMNEEVLD